ncbi:MAG: hypothetical protein H8E38_02090 [SAR324 cluster bacterium]|nr:hypothetical protein [SAR324 cluster bacterium]MBL7034917.1 hypothetical protein [SAR324 cluster bacterium]
MLCCCMILAGVSYAQESSSKDFKVKGKQSYESREATPEPDFFVTGTTARSQGFYFGVGFRRVRLTVADDVLILNSDGTANGVGFNLTYLWEEQMVEFERQVTIVEHSKSLTHQGKTGQRLEVVQNNLWYSLSPKINRDFYLHYGGGVQFSKIRFAATGNDETFVDETALALEAGASYFLTSNFLLFYRFSAGQQVPFLSASGSNGFLKQSQLHTIYLSYFFPL